MWYPRVFNIQGVGCEGQHLLQNEFRAWDHDTAASPSHRSYGPYPMYLGVCTASARTAIEESPLDLRSRSII